MNRKRTKKVVMVIRKVLYGDEKHRNILAGCNTYLIEHVFKTTYCNYNAYKHVQV